MVGLLAGAAVVALTAVGRDGSGGESSERAGSAVVAAQGAAMTFDDAPLRHYSIRYLVESGPDADSRDERVTVARPWRSLARSGGSIQASDFGVVATRPRGAEATRFTAPPALAARDARPEIALEDAVAAGAAERGERRRVLGVECQVYRTAMPLDAGPIMPPGDRRTDTCVDRRGLVLEEVLVDGGRNLTRRVAVAIDLDAAVSDADLDLDAEPPAPGEQDANLRRITAEEAAGLARWELAPPPGFDLHGHYAMAHASPDAADDPRAALSRLASVVVVWTRGVDVVIFETGATLDGTPVAEPDGAVDTVEWPATDGEEGPGPAAFLLSARGNELRRTDGSEVVRLVATVPRSELMAIASGIVSTEGDL